MSRSLLLPCVVLLAGCAGFEPKPLAPAQTASKLESILIHEEPTHRKFTFIHSVFKINPERGRVAVQVSVNDFPGAEASDSVYTKLVKGLVYDRASNEIRYGDTVCAKVREHQFLINRWHSIHETGSCAFEERRKVVVVDNGFDNPYSCSVTKIYLTVSAPPRESFELPLMFPLTKH